MWVVVGVVSYIVVGVLAVWLIALADRVTGQRVETEIESFTVGLAVLLWPLCLVFLIIMYGLDAVTFVAKWLRGEGVKS